MASPIHVDPDYLYQTARKLWREHMHLADQAYHLRLAINRLEMAWQGGSAEEHIYQMRNTLSLLNQRIDELMRLILILSRQAQAWEESDQRWALIYRGLPKGN